MSEDSMLADCAADFVTALEQTHSLLVRTWLLANQPKKISNALQASRIAGYIFSRTMLYTALKQLEIEGKVRLIGKGKNALWIWSK